MNYMDVLSEYPPFQLITGKNLKIRCMENGLFPEWDLPQKSETHPRQIPPWKMAIFHGKFQPGKWPFFRPGFFEFGV